MIKKEYLHDYRLLYEDGEKNIKYGVRHLREHLSKEESAVFFKEAHDRKSAQFEDREGHNFTIVYQPGPEPAYLLISRN